MDPVFQYIISGAAVLAAGLSIWNFIQSPSKKNAEDFAAFRTALGGDFKALDTLVDAVDRRVGTLEVIVEQMPDRASLHRLELSLKELQGQLSTMAASAQSTERTARRVEEFLIKRAEA